MEKNMATPTDLLCHGYPYEFGIFLVLSTLMTNPIICIFANSSRTSLFVEATSTITFLIGVSREVPRMMKLLVPVARRWLLGAGKLFRTARTTVQATP
jgi:hypothetical protein